MSSPKDMEAMPQPPAGKHCSPPSKLLKIKSRLGKAEDIAFLPRDRLVVADSSKCIVQEFTETGRPAPLLFSKVCPTGVTANRSGMVVFVHKKTRKQREVMVLSQDGSVLSYWGEDLDWKPHGISMSNKGQLVVSNLHQCKHTVELYSMEGHSVAKFGNKGNSSNEFLNPYYVGVDVYDRILVSDNGNNCVRLYDERSSKQIACCGSVGSGPGQLQSPRGVCSDKKGNIFVCDAGNRRVSVFNHDGRFLHHLLTKENGLQWPMGISISLGGQKLAVSQHTSSKGGSFRKIRIYGLEETV